MNKLVCGVGINDLVTTVKVNGKHLKFYSCWREMLRGCYDQNAQKRRKSSSYKGCTVCDEWLTLSNFKDWYDKQYVEPDFQLDKDIIKAGNKVYCPEYCSFVPKNLNKLLLDSSASRGYLLLGVTRNNYICKTKKENKQPFTSRCGSILRGYLHSYHKTELEAHNAWRLNKADVIEELVEKYWSDFPNLDIRIKYAFLERASKLRQFDTPIEEFY